MMLDMSKVALIAKREWRSRVRERTFRIATIANLVLVLIAACLPTTIAAFTDDDDNDATTVGILDTANASVTDRLTPFISAIGENDGPISLETVEFPIDQAATQIDDGNVDAVLEVTRNDNQALQFAYVNSDGEYDSTAQRIYAGAAAISTEDRLEQAGVSSEQFQQAIAPPAFNLVEGTVAQADDDASPGGAELIIAYLATIIMFMAIQLYGTWIAQGVVEEKNSRIMEIMVNAATPRDLLAGKIIGIGSAAMSQLLPMLIVGGLAFVLQPRLADVLGIETTSLFDSIDFGDLSIKVIGGFLVYFTFGFLMYASLYAGVASMLSRQEDINQAVAPLTMAMMGGYISAFVTIPVPDSIFARILSIFPLTSPFNMVPRLLTTDVPVWEVALSVALLIAAASVGILLAARIYRVGVLMYGQKAGLRAIFAKNLQTTSR